MAKATGIPIRTCVVCGKKAGRGELVRLVLRDGKPVADHDKRMPGRGAYVCRKVECMKNLANLKGGRPFRKPVAGELWRSFSDVLLGGTGKNQ